MIPTHFETIQDLFTKFKSLVFQLKQCGIENKEDNLIFFNILKVGPRYSVFILTFHSGELIIQNWRIPTLAYFMESLTQEKEKIVHMGTIKSTKDQALSTSVLN